MDVNQTYWDYLAIYTYIQENASLATTVIPPISFVDSSWHWKNQDSSLFSICTHSLDGLFHTISLALKSISKLSQIFIQSLDLFSAQHLYSKSNSLIPHIARQTSFTYNLSFKVVGNAIFPEAQDKSLFLSDPISKPSVNPIASSFRI